MEKYEPPQIVNKKQLIEKVNSSLSENLLDTEYEIKHFSLEFNNNDSLHIDDKNIISYEDTTLIISLRNFKKG